MAFENRRLLFGVCAILTITCLLYIIANILPIWGTVTNDSGTKTLGLWGGCEKLKNTDNKMKCEDANQSKLKMNWKDYAKITGARVFLTIACIFSSFSILSVVLILLVNADSKKIAALFTIVFSIGSLIAGIIGFALGISLVLQGNESAPSFKIGASTIIAIIALALNILGAIASFIIK